MVKCPGRVPGKKSLNKEGIPANFEANNLPVRMAGIFLYNSFYYRATEKYHAKAL